MTLESPASSRMFLALWPSQHEAIQLAQRQASLRWPKAARLTMPNNLHLTVQFIGPVPLSRLPELGSKLRVPCQAFDVKLDLVQVWPNGIAALVPTRAPDALLELHARLGEAMASVDLPVESRPYRPHVTLARSAKGLVLGQEDAEATMNSTSSAIAPVRVRARGYVLAGSQSGQYQVFQKFPST